MRVSERPYAFGYTRVSTGRQAEEGMSLESQAQRILKYYQGNLAEDYEWGGIYTDEGVSARKQMLSDRPAGGELYVRLERGDFLIFPSMDRAFRQMNDFVTLGEVWKGKGINAFFLREQVHLGSTSPIQKIAGQLLAAFAEFESSLISERGKESWAIRKRLGYRPRHASHPNGFVWVTKERFEPHWEEWKIMEYAYRLWKEDGMTPTAIWRRFNKERVRRPKKPSLNHRKPPPEDYSVQCIFILIETVRRRNWLIEHGIDPYSPEYLKATSQGQTPLSRDRWWLAPMPPEMAKCAAFPRQKYLSLVDDGYE